MLCSYSLCFWNSCILWHGYSLKMIDGPCRLSLALSDTTGQFKRILPHACFLGSSSAYFPFESVIVVLVKSSVTREDGEQQRLEEGKRKKRWQCHEQAPKYILTERTRKPWHCYIQVFGMFFLLTRTITYHWSQICHMVSGRKSVQSQYPIYTIWKYQSKFFSLIITWGRTRFSLN